jgi:sulfonate transport system substrate-binding protein
MIMRRAPVLALALAGALAATVGSARAEEPLTIRHGWVALTNTLSPLVFMKPDVMTHYGKSYVVEPTHFQGTSAELTAIASDQIDIITLGNSTLAIGVENAGLEDLRVIADGFQDGVADYFSSRYMARNDSGITTIEDLKGKVLATNVVGGSLDLAMRVMMRQHNMEDKRDYTAIDAEFPNMPAMLLQRKVDLIGIVPPWVYDPQLQTEAHVLFTMRDAIGTSQMIVLAARTPFLEKHRAQLYDFFEDELRAVHWFSDPANRSEMVAFLARVTKQPAERFDNYAFTKKDYYRDNLARPNLDSLQHDVDTQFKLGFIKSALEVRKYADLSFVEEAARRLR